MWRIKIKVWFDVDDSDQHLIDVGNLEQLLVDVWLIWSTKINLWLLCRFCINFCLIWRIYINSRFKGPPNLWEKFCIQALYIFFIC